MARPRIAVAGLNPHAGENNSLGNEETKFFLPQIKKLKNEKVLIDGPAGEAGIQTGDLITRVGSRRCRSVKQFDALVKNTKRRGMLMLHIKRDGNAQYVTLDLKK